MKRPNVARGQQANLSGCESCICRHGSHRIVSLFSSSQRPVLMSAQVMPNITIDKLELCAGQDREQGGTHRELGTP